MGEYPTELELQDGETVLATKSAADATEEGLVSDGNSRWARVDDTYYFVVNENYVAPEDAG